VRSGEQGGCTNTSLPQQCTRFCMSQWWWSVTLSWSKMTPCSSSSGFFKAKSRPHLILQEGTVKLVTVYCTNWYGMFRHKSICNEEHDMHDFRSTLTVLCNFLPLWHLGTKFSILSFQLRVNRMNPWLVRHYNMTEGLSFLQCCRWVVARTTYLALWSLLNMCQIHFAQTMVSPGCW